jgi:hypothetical protein
MLAGPGRWRRAKEPMVRPQPVAEPDLGAAAGTSASDASSTGPSAEVAASSTPELRARVAHLEQLVQGLQDSVYREAQRIDQRLAELEKRADPAALAAALSKDARERGL